LTKGFLEEIKRKADSERLQKMANAINTFSLHWGDILVLVAYFAIVIGFGIWVNLFILLKIRILVFSHHVKIVAVLVSVRFSFYFYVFFLSGGYFLAGRSMTFLPVRFLLINLKVKIK
jgi:hypothetical protein